jgi:hypothetical protein
MRRIKVSASGNCWVIRFAAIAAGFARPEALAQKSQWMHELTA